MDGHPWLGIILIAVITLIDFLVALSKAAFRNVNETLMQDKAESGDKDAESGDTFRDEEEHRFYDAVWVFTIASWLCSGMIYAAGPMRSLYRTLYDSFNEPFRGSVIAGVIVFVVTVVFIYVIVLLSHKVPDRLGKLRPDKYFYRRFGFMRRLTAFFRPMSFMLEKGCHAVLILFGIDTYKEADNVTEDEIISIVNEGQEQGVLEAGEAEMISNIISFDEKQAQDIMTHRTKIVAVDSELGIEEAMKFMAGQTFSRFPLYTGDIDNIVGVIHLKDVVKCYASGKHQKKKLIDIARKPMFVPDTQNIDDLFKAMQAKNVHMAIAIDEYGQTAGIVAMEDILEEIVGNIRDEFDKEEELIYKIAEDTYMCSGELPLDELSEVTGFRLEDEDAESFDTLNGLLISELDRIPADGETATVDYAGFRFEILEAKHKMIRRASVSKLPEETAPEADPGDGGNTPTDAEQ